MIFLGLCSFPIHRTSPIVAPTASACGYQQAFFQIATWSEVHEELRGLKIEAKSSRRL
jgi:hypothetical protein